jgi:5-methylthioribose kinase
MDSPLAPVVANFYMDHFEQQALGAASLKLTYWYRHVEHTYMVWSHDMNELWRSKSTLTASALASGLE